VVKYTLLFFLLVGINAMANETLLVDPTQPINYKTKSAVVKKKSRAALPKLQSILGSGEQRKAIINNKLYSAGQLVNGYRITGIEKDAVLLKYKSRTYKVTLYTKKERFIE
jgi:MSHA biogenesis protein MshK